MIIKLCLIVSLQLAGHFLAKEYLDKPQILAPEEEPIRVWKVKQSQDLVCNCIKALTCPVEI
jgi:hypothetical protein